MRKASWRREHPKFKWYNNWDSPANDIDLQYISFPSKQIKPPLLPDHPVQYISNVRVPMLQLQPITAEVLHKRKRLHFSQRFLQIVPVNIVKFFDECLDSIWSEGKQWSFNPFLGALLVWLTRWTETPSNKKTSRGRWRRWLSSEPWVTQGLHRKQYALSRSRLFLTYDIAKF